jgi:chemotaxis protein methyltransferase CheR
MFRDPTVFQKIREEIIPQLASYPVIKIWSAGCATGEEPFSLAILLHEAGLLQRSVIYATDVDPYALSIAKEGRYNLTGLTKSIENYYLSGGKEKFSDYYTIDHNSAFFDPKLSNNICFAEHNLITDAPFNEFQLILCRNVFIYFDTNLQSHSLMKFDSSLETGGFFVSGKQEYLEHTGINHHFEPYDIENKIYRKGLR